MADNNFRDLIDQKVNVDIACYSYGFMYPEENILVEVTDTHYIFKSNEIETEDGLWRFDHTDKDCGCEISLCDIVHPQ